MKRFLAILVFIVSAPFAAYSQTLAIGIGTTDYGDRGSDSAALELDYTHKPFNSWRNVDFAFGATASITGEGDFFVGVGIANRLTWNNGWFLDASLMPGYYHEGVPGNDLGSRFEFRSLIGVGYEFQNGHALSVAFTHKSNASLAENNPGMNSYLIRYHISF